MDERVAGGSTLVLSKQELVSSLLYAVGETADSMTAVLHIKKETAKYTEVTEAMTLLTLTKLGH